MRIKRGGPAVAGLALSLGALAACGTGGGSGDAAQPPTAGATSPAGAQQQRSASPEASSPLDGKVIVIDPGHNGGNAEHPSEINKQVKIGNGSKACDTTGTSTNDGYAEHAFTWDVSKRLEKALEAEGAEVTLTRDSDDGVGPCITERAGIGNELKADAALSVHADGTSASGHGFHIIAPKAIERNAAMAPASRELGTAIRDAYKEGTGVPYSNYLGEKGMDFRDDLGGLNMSTVPKVFIECGNMRNADDAAKMKDPQFRERIAVSIAQGFEKYFA
ncbi:N-acetylmuramoyl-L-alanine amidase [Actinomadura algeriensis]|uniref:N-acetylmuramoyl-L-alanine amidase n=1 Tax=Actinomadura algeriensis TaxID=1679523 RepID=A0ABR9JMU7_9ACTN|nr:N-acetylmuramoyl-L-alanine amidase [Actinomadura algeriensis]MBE1531862.1 N-acetylmuramoyl-L-alanine amidase [Actinomadura algeriensis]